MIPNSTLYFYRKMSDYGKAVNTIAKFFMLAGCVDIIAKVFFETVELSTTLMGGAIMFTACMVFCGMSTQMRSFAWIGRRQLLIPHHLPPVRMPQLILLTS